MLDDNLACTAYEAVGHDVGPLLARGTAAVAGAAIAVHAIPFLGAGRRALFAHSVLHGVYISFAPMDVGWADLYILGVVSLPPVPTTMLATATPRHRVPAVVRNLWRRPTASGLYTSI